MVFSPFTPKARAPGDAKHGRSGLRRLALAAVLAVAAMSPQVAIAEVPTIVLVHGMNVDGTTWRPVYDALTAQGYQVRIVQQPLNGFENDLRATRRVLDGQTGDVLLVGHSYGGVVITSAGTHPAVRGLVYVAALQPDAGETMASLNETMPSAFDPDGSVSGEDGYVTLTLEGYRRDVAPDLSEIDAAFQFASQTPTSSDVFGAETVDPAWHHKPTFGIVATQDRVVSPDLQRWMYRRAGGPVTEIAASHMLIVSQAEAVADAIASAAEAVSSDNGPSEADRSE